MNISLLSLLVLLNLTASKTPNFYPSFLAAKAASKNYQKDMLIFFSKPGCTECDVAWAAFEKDPNASKIFISTMVNARDFDGAVILDKYGLSSTPSWAILDYEGNLKQKWAGDWQNPHARPTTPPVAAEAKPEMPPIKEFKATTVNSTTTPPAPAKTTAVPPTEKELTPSIVTEEKVMEVEKPAPVTSPVVPAAGFVLQAGYFGSEANALKLIADLEAKGFNAYSIKSLSQNGSTFYRVVSSIYATETEANKGVESLSTAGIKATVKKTSEI